MTDDTKIVDLAATVRAKEEAKALEEAKKAGPRGPRTDLVYEFALRNGDTFQADGMLMVNGSFFATGIPTEDGMNVDITFASPIERIEYAQLISDEELTEEAN